jgi:hypothetical protein
VTDQHHVVDGRFALEHGLKVSLQVRKVTGKARQNAATGGHAVLVRICGDRGKSAIAADHCGHPLRQLEFHTRVAEEGAVVVSVGVDETRREREAAAVYLTCRRRAT